MTLSLEEASKKVSPTMRKILEALKDKSEFVSANNLASEVYADDPEGGPLTAGLSIKTLVRRHRPKLAACGWKIEHKPGQVGGLRLLPVEEETI